MEKTRGNNWLRDNLEYRLACQKAITSLLMAFDAEEMSRQMAEHGYVWANSAGDTRPTSVPEASDIKEELVNKCNELIKTACQDSEVEGHYSSDSGLLLVMFFPERLLNGTDEKEIFEAWYCPLSAIGYSD